MADLQVPLEKGYSQMDWLRLTRSKPTPVRRRDITLAEVKQHNKPDDAWMVFQSRVRREGSMPCHPGLLSVIVLLSLVELEVLHMCGTQRMLFVVLKTRTAAPSMPPLNFECIKSAL